MRWLDSITDLTDMKLGKVGEIAGPGVLWFMGWQRVGHNGATELLLLGRKVITNLDSILKSRDITLLT